MSQNKKLKKEKEEDRNIIILKKEELENRKLVKTFLDQSSELDVDNFHFTADIFAPEDHYLHIKETFGFKKWVQEQKEKKD